MENKITLKSRLPIITFIALALLGFSVMVAELIVHVSAKKRKATLPAITNTPMEPKQVLLTVYQEANKYFLGDKTVLNQAVYTYCSKPLIQEFSKTPGIMEQTFARETRIGRLKKVEVVTQHYQGADSAMVSARAFYNDGFSKTFNQLFVKENGRWKLGLSYGRDIN
ncbi:DUF4878 domain-containing protein [Spirosoma sp. HMF3257]|uniref:Uncharacterized protein n=1 Tax=Spirosoma telluris TaxID=2183553 RepID=A0A327NGH9_9BACT|nr:DUF4878 domain-containing protein [Spirosoma telluris]RAI73064.1 hypothetical protein HMF3257_37305 [Spirosoma telluris]